MRRDPIVEATRNAGVKYAARFGFDLKKMFADLARREQERAAKSASPKAGRPPRPRTTRRLRRAA